MIPGVYETRSLWQQEEAIPSHIRGPAQYDKTMFTKVELKFELL